MYNEFNYTVTNSWIYSTTALGVTWILTPFNFIRCKVCIYFAKYEYTVIIQSAQIS